MILLMNNLKYLKLYKKKTIDCNTEMTKMLIYLYDLKESFEEQLWTWMKQKKITKQLIKENLIKEIENLIKETEIIKRNYMETLEFIRVNTNLKKNYWMSSNKECRKQIEKKKQKPLTLKIKQ